MDERTGLRETAPWPGPDQGRCKVHPSISPTLPPLVYEHAGRTQDKGFVWASRRKKHVFSHCQRSHLLFRVIRLALWEWPGHFCRGKPSNRSSSLVLSFPRLSEGSFLLGYTARRANAPACSLLGDGPAICRTSHRLPSTCGKSSRSRATHTPGCFKQARSRP